MQCANCRNSAKYGSLYCTPCGEAITTKTERERFLGELRLRLPEVHDEGSPLSAVCSVLADLIDHLKEETG